MARIVWTATAKSDVRDIVQYISRDSKTYARAFAFRLKRSVTRLAAFPEAGRQVPEDPTATYREIIVGNYRVLYRSSKDRVVIVAVLHGARSIQPLMEEGLE